MPDAPTEADKQRARWVVQKRMQRGTLRRKHKCERCPARQKNEQLEAHHPDYFKPLDVVFLCRACHRKEHAATDIYWEDIPE